MSPGPFTQQVTFLYARFPAPCWDFYEQVLGLPLVRDQGRCRIYAVAGGAFLGLCEARALRASENPRVEGGNVFTFVTDDVEGWYAALMAKGVALAAPPAWGEGNRVLGFFLKDPAGNTLEIQRFEEPIGQGAIAGA